MAMKYKPTRQKKEKAVKEPKAPKAEKALKFGSATKVKTKAPKAPKEPKVKAPKAEKVVTFKPGKVENAANLEKTTVLKKPLNMKIVGIVAAALVVVAILAITVVLPAIERHGQEIDYIMISSAPNKTKYLVGEEANYDGLRVLVIRNNGETFTVRANNCQITGFDSKEAGDLMITVNYEGFSASFYLSVEATVNTPPLESIEMLTYPKTEYKVDEWLDTMGGEILRKYVDGSSDPITIVNSDISGFVIDAQAGTYVTQTPGQYTLTVSYTDTVHDITRTCTYPITVSE